MSERRTDRQVDQTLASWMGDVAPDRPPTRLLEGTFARTMKARQARTYPWHGVGIRFFLPGTGSGSRTGALVLVALVVAALVVGLVAGGPTLFPPPSPRPSPTPGATPAAKPTTRPTAAPLPASIVVTPEALVTVQGPIAMVNLGSTIWVMGAGELTRVDPDANAVTASVTLGSPTELYNGLAANDAGLWATNSDVALLYRVDLTSLKVSARIPAGLAPKGVLASAAGVWVADVHDGVVLRIDPATNTVAARITVGPVGNSGPNWLASGLGSLWVDIPNNSTIVRFDPVTNAIQATIQVPGNVLACGGFAIETDAAWVTGCSGARALARIDPTFNTVIATVDLHGFGSTPTVINGGLWVSVDTGDADSGMLVRVDRAANTIDRVLVTGSAFGGGGDIVVAAGSVWVVDGYNNALLRLPLTAFGP